MEKDDKLKTLSDTITKMLSQVGLKNFIVLAFSVEEDDSFVCVGDHSGGLPELLARALMHDEQLSELFNRGFWQR
jgi:hypothetical protein